MSLLRAWGEGRRSPRVGAGSDGVRGGRRGQRGSYEDVEQALVLHVDPQPSLVLHMNTVSGVAASTTRMSNSKSSSVTTSASGAVGASRTAASGAIDITLLTGCEGDYSGHLAWCGVSRALLNRVA